jgi:hypothetical protein
MKHVKILGLLVMAAASLAAFADSASAAPVLTSPAGTEYTGAIEATMAPGTSSILKAGIEDTCTESTASGTVSSNTEVHAVGSGNTNTGKCTQDTNTIQGGSLTITDKGEVFAIGSRVEVKVTSLGISCFYGGGPSPGTKIGTLTSGSPAKLTVNTTQLKRLEGSNTFFCAPEATGTTEYVVTKPSSLFVT